MHFAFTEDQAAITEAAREMLVESCTPTDLRRLLASDEAFDTARWATIREMGLLGICVPEDQGGLGLDTIDLIGIAEAAGYVALPEPLIDQAGLIAPLLASLGGPVERVLASEILAIGHPANPFVTDADSAAALLLDHQGEVHLVARDTVTLIRMESFDPFRRLFRVEWTPSNATRVAGDWGDIVQRGQVLIAAQLIGLGQRCVDLAVAYAKDRQQFGKPIGSYQAIKHLVATAQVAIEFARPVVQAAAAELPLDNLASRTRAAHAKLAAARAADLAARTAVQVHGAMGMTWEVDVHFFLKRAMALKTAWSTPAADTATVIERMTTAPTGPAMTFASEVAQAAG
ncbi:acyl-CoA dehydrogenase family protein [Novosphingobium sp. JCM 18896]|uniref:acyl-CoA dehydrogenase family protein n=1 Tax=Novosphingobium sp. JCM 18896 TaxID=2989731 RepID=UPI002222DAE7|nr:acyl-CoA dehydrogenase family protein [Novosphingobium sp. JCM 18896]MCW1428720.1 acyl-CoA/acyl-ACP dehydrogenase [Novosphingobium sp. JCM 18896]